MGVKGKVDGVVELLGELVEWLGDGGVLVGMERMEFLKECEGVGFDKWGDIEGSLLVFVEVGLLWVSRGCGVGGEEVVIVRGWGGGY